MAESTTPRLDLPRWTEDTDTPNRAEFDRGFLRLEERVAAALVWDSTGDPDAIPRPAASAAYDRFLSWDRATGRADLCVDTTGAGGWAWVEVLTRTAGSAAYAPLASASTRGARVFASAAQSVAADTLTALNFNSESFDTDALHDNATNNNQVKLNKVGKWLVVGQITYASGATGRRQAYLRRNGTVTALTSLMANSVGSTIIQVHDIVEATAATDFADLAAYHEQGAAINVSAGTAATWLSAVYLGA